VNVEAMKQQWAILELFGHRVLAGRVSEVERFGGKLCRIEVPIGPAPGSGEESFVAQEYGHGAIYCLTPCAEEVARAQAWRSHALLRPLLPAGSGAIAEWEPRLTPEAVPATPAATEEPIAPPPYAPDIPF
jgi:hypothetical protein